MTYHVVIEFAEESDAEEFADEVESYNNVAVGPDGEIKELKAKFVAKYSV